MEDESASITIKVEVQDEIVEDQSIATEQFGISEEHNYNKVMEEDLYYRLQVHHSIDIKEESEEVESGNSCFDEITIQQQIEAEKQMDELIKNNVIANQDPTEFSIQQQNVKEEDLDIELGELHDTFDIKMEDDPMTVDNHMQEEYRLVTDANYQATNGNLRNNTQGEGKTTKYLTLEDFGEVKTQRMPISSSGLFLKQFIEIERNNNLLQTQLRALALSKANLAEQKMQQYAKKHQRTLQRMREKHELKLQCMTEKHNLEMEILLLEKKKLLLRKCVCDDSNN